MPTSPYVSWCSYNSNVMSATGFRQQQRDVCQWFTADMEQRHACEHGTRRGHLLSSLTSEGQSELCAPPSFAACSCSLYLGSARHCRAAHMREGSKCESLMNAMCGSVVWFGGFRGADRSEASALPAPSTCHPSAIMSREQCASTTACRRSSSEQIAVA